MDGRKSTHWSLVCWTSICSAMGESAHLVVILAYPISPAAEHISHIRPPPMPIKPSNFQLKEAKSPMACGTSTTCSSCKTCGTCTTFSTARRLRLGIGFLGNVTMSRCHWPHGPCLSTTGLLGETCGRVQFQDPSEFLRIGFD